MSKTLRNMGIGAVLVMVGMWGLSACDMVGAMSDYEAAPTRVLHPPKMRHSHLLPEPSSGKIGADSVHLLIGYDPMYEAQRVFRTYRVFRRFRVVRRYEYDTVLDGEAITVGPEEFQALLDSLESDPSVAWIEPDYDVPVGQALAGMWIEKDQKTPWGIKSVEADESLYESGDKRDKRGVPNVDLYVLDSGADSRDLNVVECLEFQGGDFGPCQRTTDLLGHGTAVAGVAAAMDNRIGVVGTAPGAPLRIIRTLNALGYSTESRIVKALDLVTARKLANPSRPVVVNLSFGAYVGTTEFTAMDEAVQAAIDAGVVVVVSAGNDARDASLYSPAHVPDAITVGAYTKSKKFASFSNYGPMLDLLAPGDELELLVAGDLPNRLMKDSGTSFAAPHVSGAAAVVLSVNPRWTPKQVRDHLVRRASNFSAPSGTTRKALNMDELGEDDD